MRRLDPWGPVFALAGTVVFLLHGFGGTLTRDLALYSYSGQQLVEGVPPYVSVLNRAGPLAHMVPGAGAAIARVIGTDDLLTQRVVMMVLSIAAVWLMYVVGRDAFESRLAGAATATSLLLLQGFVTYATGGPREKTTMMLLVVCTMLAVTHRRWAWAGVSVALATLTWQPVFVAGAAMTIAALVALPRRQIPDALLRFVVGGLVPTALMCGYFLAVGAFRDFLDGFYLINARYTDQEGLTEFLDESEQEIVNAFGWSLWVLLAGLAASILLALLRIRGFNRTDPRQVSVVAFGVATIASLLWCIRVFNGWADAVFMFPLAAAGLGGAVLLVTRRLPSAAVVPVVATYAVAGLVAAGAQASVSRANDLEPLREVSDDLLAAAGPDVSVQSIGAPQPLVFGNLRNPTRHQMFIAGLDDYLEENYPGGLAAIGEQIGEDQPTFVTMDHPTWYPWAAPTLEEEYVELGQTQLVTWFAHRSLGSERLAELKAIVSSGPPPM
ncbi:glycosyltransferase family 39 protein [Nocardioides sp.]|uniref:glycosyltransferase family 39 protein n=1 Tax=Nocardioides sp. TaxID=35761 RepID=UPI002ED64FEA